MHPRRGNRVGEEPVRQGPKLTRRRVIQLGVGSAGLVALPAMARAEAEPDQRIAVGYVASDTRAGASELVVNVGGRSLTVTPEDFAGDWGFRAGDYISVDVALSKAFHYLEPALAAADGPGTHRVPNASGRESRTVRRSGR